MTDDRTEIATLTPLEREAQDWLARLSSGEATDADAAALRQWCAQSPAHGLAFAEARRFWTLLRPAGEEFRVEAPQSATWTRARASAGRAPSRRLVLGGALAASAAALAVIRPPLGLWPSIFELNADYRTGPGEQRRIAIADLGAVELNTRTSLSLRGDAQARTIELVAGEADFEITQSRPVTVLAAGGRASAREARFEVRVEGTAVRVTCLSAAVDVACGARTVTLLPNQRVSYGAGELSDVTAVDPSLAGAWRQGLIICNNTPLPELVSELNRYRQGRILLVRPALVHLVVSGRFRTTEPDQALLQLQRAFGLAIRHLPGGFALLS